MNGCGLVFILAFVGITQAMLRVPYLEYLEDTEGIDEQVLIVNDEIDHLQNMNRIVTDLITNWNYLSKKQKKMMVSAIINMAPYKG